MARAQAAARAADTALFWIPPSLDGIFANSKGTTPATKDGVVGLMLDGAYTAGNRFGPNLAPGGGTFDSATGLIVGSGWSITGGEAVAVSAAGHLSTSAQIVQAGKWYQVSITCKSITAGNVVLVYEGGTNPLGITITAPGTYTGYARAPTTGRVYLWAGGSLSGVFDNLQVRECLGYQAWQDTTGFMPTLRQGAVNLLLNSATLSTQNVTTQAISYTLHFTGTGTITLSGTATGAKVGNVDGSRCSHTFTTTAGTLTLTVSGSVTAAMLEVGSTASQYVATTTVPLSNGFGAYWLDFNGAATQYLFTNKPIGGELAEFSLIGAGAGYVDTSYISGAYTNVPYRAFLARNASGYISGGAGNLGHGSITSNVSWATKKVGTLIAATAGSALYVDGVSADTDTPTYSGTAIAQYIGAINNNGTAANFWTGPIALAAIGATALTDAQQAAIERLATEQLR